ncbi:GreA/GreB family elongation factor [Aureimonas frigidaquae]|uniref:Possible transcription elongation factor, GreA/GreB family n=1 Tax=Aureimonas frigidaquae TaxID=424757 RepID=A0A0P0YZP5_9HYPH|nr:GreA/GreB family elongation factor [Aureimonas frigidaquae]BAT27172.1 possible transcription elongation factor, GreA/GreB family [Aureimonas frigidaquae]
MSVAFVKEPNEDQVEALPERELGSEPNFVTPRGLALLDAEIDGNEEKLDLARAAGDKIAMAMINRDLRYFRARRSTAQPVTPQPDSDTVQFGHRVSIGRAKGTVQTFQIVGIDEADPARGLISYLSPLARQLVGKEEGETVRIGPDTARILAIALPEDAPEPSRHG